MCLTTEGNSAAADKVVWELKLFLYFETRNFLYHYNMYSLYFIQIKKKNIIHSLVDQVGFWIILNLFKY